MIYVAKALRMILDLKKRDGYDFSHNTRGFLWDRVKYIESNEIPVFNDILPSEQDWIFLEDRVAEDLDFYLYGQTEEEEEEEDEKDDDIGYEEKLKRNKDQVELFKKAVAEMEEYCLLRNA